jgi:hypothetical protein
LVCFQRRVSHSQRINRNNLINIQQPLRLQEQLISRLELSLRTTTWSLIKDLKLLNRSRRISFKISLLTIPSPLKSKVQASNQNSSSRSFLSLKNSIPNVTSMKPIRVWNHSLSLNVTSFSNLISPNLQNQKLKFRKPSLSKLRIYWLGNFLLFLSFRMAFVPEFLKSY